jgi:2'-5' RNA ligase
MAREARKRKPRIRVPRGHEACSCCDGYGTHDDRTQCRRCEGDGHLTAGSNKPFCGDQGGSQRRTAALQGGASRSYGDYEMRYGTEDTGARKPAHVIEVHHPEDGKVGFMRWMGTAPYAIDKTEVHENHRRQGLATAMWDWAQEEGRPKPTHSRQRTDAGDAWARSVGGPLPRREASAEPFEFDYAHNTEKAPDMGEMYGQHIEPHGRYMVQRGPSDTYHLDPRWELGTHRFENPLHLDAEGWKQRLSEQHGGKTGRELSQAVRDAGHDGIVTHETYRGRSHTGEIVDLTGFKRTAAEHAQFVHDFKPTGPGTDWDRVHPTLPQTVHRGAGFMLSPKDHEYVHDASIPAEERGRHLIGLMNKHAYTGGIGKHWSTDPWVAHHFAAKEAGRNSDAYKTEKPDHKWGTDDDGDPRYRPATMVMLRAKTPAREDLDPDHHDIWGHRVDYETHDEKETPIIPGRPVHVTGMSWGTEDDPAPDDDGEPQTLWQHHEDDYYGPAAPPHHAYPHNADFEKALKHHAAPLKANSSGFFHGTRAVTPLRVGEHLTPGHESAMQMSSNDKVYFTHDPQGAEKYARGAPRAGVKIKGKPVVYEVEPTGPFHEDPGSPGYRSPHPLRVTRVHQVPHTPLRQTGYTMPARGPMSNGGAKSHPLYEGKDPEYEGDAEHFEDMWYGHEAARALPTDRIFGPTYGLDHRLFTGDKLHPDVIEAVMNRLDQVLRVDSQLVGANWMSYIEVYLAGSEASEWTSPTLEGNDDFDTLLGVDYDELRGNDGRGASAEWVDKTDDEINDIFNDVLKRFYNDENWDAPFGGVWHLTGYVNGDAYDIRRIKPYAAYDLNKDEWAVKPPHLPEWGPQSFPQGPALWKQAEAIADEIEAILELPEPYRTQQGASLYDHLHEDRHRAFGDHGEGWYDNGNVIEKYLDQLGLWAKLLHLKKNSEHETFDDGEQPFLEAMAGLEKEAVDATGAMMVAFVPPDHVIDHLVQEDGEQPDELHITLLYLGKEAAYTPKQITQLPVLVQQWAKTQSPMKARTQGAGTFVNEGEHVLWAAVDIPGSTWAHNSLVEFLRGHGMPIKLEHGFTPHITLRYDKYHVRFLPKITPMSWDVDQVWFCRGEDWIPFKLGG